MKSMVITLSEISKRRRMDPGFYMRREEAEHGEHPQKCGHPECVLRWIHKGDVVQCVLMRWWAMTNELFTSLKGDA